MNFTRLVVDKPFVAIYIVLVNFRFLKLIPKFVNVRKAILGRLLDWCSPK